MKLRNRFERFCFRHRNWGIPNLMLYIVIGCGVVSIFDMIGYDQLYNLLAFNRSLILQGQVWRLVTYIFTTGRDGFFVTTLILLYCDYSLGRAVEREWGTFKFNLYYLCGIVLMDIFAMLFGGMTVLWVPFENIIQYLPVGQDSFYANYMVTFLHLSMVICFATQYPETKFLLLYLIPIKAKILSLIYLGYTLFMVISFTVPIGYLPHNLFPLVAMLNYFLFVGSDIKNLLPLSWQVAFRRGKRKAAAKKEPIQFRRGDYTAPSKKEALPYHHRCTVCGRTDTTNPELEFRYCSRCNGYHCYCSEHINDHTHVQ